MGSRLHSKSQYIYKKTRGGDRNMKNIRLF